MKRILRYFVLIFNEEFNSNRKLTYPLGKPVCRRQSHFTLIFTPCCVIQSSNVIEDKWWSNEAGA